MEPLRQVIIYTLRRDVFTGSLLMASIWGYSANSVTVTQPITFSSYGTGAKPSCNIRREVQRMSYTKGGILDCRVDYVVLDGLNFT